MPHREADQDLVPEQEDEVEEGEQGQGRGRRPRRESGTSEHLIRGKHVMEKHFWIIIRLKNGETCVLAT